MPLDPNIILQAGQPLPNQPNMLGQYAAVQQIQQNKLAMMAQQQAMALGQVHQQSAQLALSQQQLEATQQQQAVQALKDSNGDVDKASSTLLAAGNQQGLVLQKNKDAISEILAKINQQNSAAAKDQAETQFKQLDRTTNALSTVLDAPDELKPVIYQGLRAQAIQSGLPGAQNLPPTWTPQAAQMVTALQQSSMTAKDRIDAGLKRQQQAAEQSHWTNEEQLTAARDYNTNQNEALNRQSINQYRQAEIGIRGKEVGLAGARLGLEKSRFQQEFGGGEGAGSQPLPGALETIAQQVAAGEKKLPRGMKGYTAIAMRAQAINPNLTDETYNTVQSYMNADGKESQKMGAMTRVLGHIEDYHDASQKLGNSVSTSLGMNLPSNAALHKYTGAVSNELGRLVEQNAITESDKAHWESGLNSGREATRTATIEAMRKVLGSQLQNIWQNYHKATLKELPVDRVFDKPTRDRLRRFYPELLPGQSAGQQAGAVGDKRPPLESIFGAIK